MKGAIKILGTTGHQSIPWDTDQPSTVTIAEELFNEAIAPAYRVAFAIGPDGSGTIVKEFDPQVKEYVVMSQISGG